MRKIFLALLSSVFLMAPIAPFAFAQDGQPFGNSGPDEAWSNLDFSNLVETGTVQVPPPDGIPYVEGTIPGTDIDYCLGCLTYNTYTTSDGQYTVVAPDIYSATVMAATGTGPLANEPIYSQTSDAQRALLMATGGYENMGISNWQVATDYWNGALNTWTLGYLGYTSQTYSNTDPFTFVQMMYNNLQPGGQNDFVLSTGYFVYPNGSNVDECYGPFCNHPQANRRPPFIPPSLRRGQQSTSVPTNAAPTPFPIQQQYIAIDCPRDERVEQADPSTGVSARKISPNYPIVVGQDPQKVGVTFAVTMNVPPVFFSYNIKNVYQSCEGSGCGQAPGTGPVTIITYETCDRVVETYTDNLASINISADLTPDSINWINTTLASKYPGAHVYKANWQVFPGLCGASGIDSPSFSAQCDRVQFADPGWYLVNAKGSTTGTPVSPPRPFSWSQQVFGVDLMETALIK